MRRALINVLALLLGSAAINLGTGLQSSLLGLRAGIESFSTIAFGLVTSSYYLGFVIGSLISPTLVNRVGHIRTFAIFASLASASALLHAVFVSPLPWVAMRGLTGLCLSGLCVVTESWLNERSSNLNRGTLLSTYFGVSLGATALGQTLLVIAPATGYDLFILVSVVFSVALVPVALTTTPMPSDIEPRRMGLRQLFAASQVGVIGCLCAGLGISSFWGLGVIYAKGIGLDIPQIALFMTLLIIGGALTQWPLGRLSDLTDRRRVIAAISLAMTVVGAIIASNYFNQSPWLFALAALAGGLMLPLYGIAIAHTNDRLDARSFVPASASLLLVYGCGAAAGPLLATLFIDIFGPSGLFIYAAIIGAIVGGYSLFAMSQRPQVRQEDITDYAPVPRTSAIAFELDPRAEFDEDGTPDDKPVA